MKNKLTLITLTLILVLPMVLAEQNSLGIFKQNNCIELKQICNCSYVNVSSVTYPDSSQALSMVSMTKLGTEFNYTFCNTSQLGTYLVTGFGDDNGENTIFVYDFDITGNGKPAPAGSIVVLFSIIFLISVILTGFMALYTIGHLMSLDFDIIDLSFDWGIYFGIIAVYFLQEFYLGNNSIGDWLLLLIKIGGVLLILVPMVALILSITIGTLNKRNVQTIQQPRKFRWRR